MLLIARNTVAGALAGLVIGALEGMHRYKYPNPLVLLRPDVSYIIFFLGPLLDGLAAGIFGFFTGLLIASRSSRIWRRVALFVGICLVAILVLAIAKDPAYAKLVLMGTYPSPFRLTIRAGVLLGGAGIFIFGRHLPLRALSVILAGAFVMSMVGVGVYVIRPPVHRAGVATISAAPIGKPNIILITLDTVRADHLSLYGYPRRTTPSIDKWAHQGVVFDNAITSTSWTLPSHASIFTGLLPHQHGADYAEPLDPSWWTISDVLSARGYETAGFTTNLGYGAKGWGMGNGFESYDDDATSVRHNLKSLLLGNMLLQSFYGKYVRPDRMDRRDAGQVNRDVLRWFRQRSPRPFYVFINYFDVHEPYVIPQLYDAPFGNGSPWLLGRMEEPLRGGDLEYYVASYDNCLAFLDKSVGDLLDSLSRLPGWKTPSSSSLPTMGRPSANTTITVMVITFTGRCCMFLSQLWAPKFQPALAFRTWFEYKNSLRQFCNFQVWTTRHFSGPASSVFGNQGLNLGVLINLWCQNYYRKKGPQLPSA